MAENVDNNHAVSRQASIYICCSSKYFDPLYGSSYLVTFYHYCNNIFPEMKYKYLHRKMKNYFSPIRYFPF